MTVGPESSAGMADQTLNDSVYQKVVGPVYDYNTSTYALKCVDQLFLTVWYPQNVTQSVMILRGFVYLLSMSYVFIGVAIAADKL